MQIGFIEQRQMTVKDKQEPVTWFEMVIKAPGIREFRLKVVENKDAGQNKPAFHLYYRTNQKKGENYRDLRAGALWNAVSQDGQTQYLSGNIESPAIPGGRLWIACFNAKAQYENEQVMWLYDVIWSPQQNKSDEDSQTYGQAVAPQQNQQPAAQAQNFQQPQGQPNQMQNQPAGNNQQQPYGQGVPVGNGY